MKEGGLSDRVHFAGGVSGEEKVRLLKASDVFVLPSRSEGFSMALLEALAIGLPAVCTSGSFSPELSDLVGIRWSESSPQALAEAILSMLDRKLEHLELVSKSQAQIRERFDCSVVGAQMAALYRSILKR